MRNSQPSPYYGVRRPRGGRQLANHEFRYNHVKNKWLRGDRSFDAQEFVDFHNGLLNETLLKLWMSSGGLLGKKPSRMYFQRLRGRVL